MRTTAGSTDAIAVLSGDDGVGVLALPVAARARLLLAANRAVLLSLTIATRGSGRAVTMCWTGVAEPVALAATLDLDWPELRDAHAAFERAGACLLAQLVRRWPANAVPPAIGIVTDGCGVVFSPDHPSPLCPYWLALHQAGRCSPTTLLAFSARGSWASLSRTATSRVH